MLNMLFLSLGFAVGAVGHTITTPPPRNTAFVNGLEIGRLYGGQPNNWLGRRQDEPLYNCDGSSKFFCPTTPTSSGTCYTGGDGYIGCCSVSSCAARTTCLDYTKAQTATCDINSGGCWLCTDSASPSCVTLSNTVASQHIFYCDATGLSSNTAYVNPITTGSQAAPPTVTSSDMTSSTSSSSSSTTSDSSSQTELSTSSSGLSTPTSSTSPNGQSAHSTALTKGATIAIAIASCFVIGLLVFIVSWYMFRRRGRSNKSSPDQTTGTNNTTEHADRDAWVGCKPVTDFNTQSDDTGATTEYSSSSPTEKMGAGSESQARPGDAIAVADVSSSLPSNPPQKWDVKNEINHPEGPELDAPMTIHELEDQCESQELPGTPPNSTARHSISHWPLPGTHSSIPASLRMAAYPGTASYAPGPAPQGPLLGVPNPHNASSLSVTHSSLSTSWSSPHISSGSAPGSVNQSPTFPPSPISSTAEQEGRGRQRTSSVSAVMSGLGRGSEGGNGNGSGSGSGSGNGGERSYTAYHPSAQPTMETTATGTSVTGAWPGFQSAEEAMSKGFFDRRE